MKSFQHAPRPQPRGVSRIELLVCASVLAAGIGAIAGPISNNIQGAAAVDRCKRNLGRLGQLSAMAAMQDRLSVLHPQSYSGLNSWLGLGQFDWGGADGACGETNDAWPAGQYPLGASSRPYNRLLYGDTPLTNADFSLFRCPADAGTDPNALFRATYASEAPCTAQEVEDAIRHSMFRMIGNSYTGDFIWQNGGTTSGGNGIALRFGSFLRPAEYFPNPSETLLFYEHRFAQAFMSSAESVQQNLGVGNPVPVSSWHQPGGLFNLVNADGHVQSVEVHVSGSLLDPTSMPSSWIARLRGQTWRYDAYPEVTIRERTFGSPLMFAPGDGSENSAIRSSPEYTGAPPQ